MSIYLVQYTYPGVLRSIDEVDDDVNRLYDATERVDGDEKGCICFDECIVQPKHGTE